MRTAERSLKPAGKAGRKIGLALAGGGPLGAMYELGALTALAEGIEGIDFNRLDVYVGVSAGAFIAAGLANGITPRQMCRMFVDGYGEESGYPLRPELFVKPAYGEYLKRVASLPALFGSALWDATAVRRGRNWLASFERLSRAIPTGIFDNRAIAQQVEGLFSAHGRTNDFRQLERRLYIVATDLDSGKPVVFGDEGYDGVPISTAVQASSALPGLFPPVEVGGRYFVDGALKKTLHASVALRDGADLLICVNPLVPYDAALAASRSEPRHEMLVAGGLPVVLAQTFRAIIHSRMATGMAAYRKEFAKADVVLFEPHRDDAEMFFANMFSYTSRRRLTEHAYERTRSDLLARRADLEPILARYGASLRLDVLRDPTRVLLPPSEVQRVRAKGTALAKATRSLSHSLEDLEHWLAGRAGSAGSV